MRSREDLRNLLQDRLERRALLRELLAEHVRAQEGRLSGLASERLENAADERSGTETEVDREDLRGLILDRSATGAMSISFWSRSTIASKGKSRSCSIKAVTSSAHYAGRRHATSH